MMSGKTAKMTNGNMPQNYKDFVLGNHTIIVLRCAN